MSQPIYLTQDIRRIEQAAGAASPPLMERAGAAAAQLAAQLLSDRDKDVLVLAGPGNNGGDARVAARLLAERFFRVTLAARPQDVPSGRRWGLVVDGLFGIGLARAVEGDHAKLIDIANAQRCPVLALDIPSGVASDTGQVLGRAVRATHTITFIALKPGLLTLDGPDHCGVVHVADLALEPAAPVASHGWVAAPELFSQALRPRQRNFHKGQAGSLAILGGASGMTGAALLAGRAALQLGTGRVYVGLLDQQAPAVDHGAPELMLRHPDEALGMALDALVVGPGLGQGERAETLLAAALASDLPCVLDADALNLIAENSDLRHACARRAAETLVTPHPGEAARLLALSPTAVQADRLGAARTLAANLNAHAVLKGNGSVIVARDGHWFINTTGNPGMASAGMGDVLAGILGALLAQGCPGEAALGLGVHLHGAAADECVAAGDGPVGLTASELIAPARRLWNGWLRSAASSGTALHSPR
ncbi:MAG: NAD(P)H-hydrate dehydratase [Betaproteobacteria bacterium]|nr:MAG: NAD(P)H-hydrate dehydratase [Betaproteobacteria bacterium]